MGGGVFSLIDMLDLVADDIWSSVAYILFSHIRIFRDLNWGFIKDKSRDVSVWMTKKQNIFRSSSETLQVQDLWFDAIPPFCCCSAGCDCPEVAQTIICRPLKHCEGLEA